MIFLLIIFFFFSQLSFSMNVPSLFELAKRKITSDFQCNRRLMNLEPSDFNRIAKIIDEQQVRADFIKNSELIKMIGNQKMNKKEIFSYKNIAPECTKFWGTLKADFDDSFETVWINCLGTIKEGGSAKCLVELYFNIEFSGETKSVVLEERKKAVPTKILAAQTLKDEYGIIAQSARINPQMSKLLSNKETFIHLNEDTYIYLYDLSERNKFMDSTRETISFAQLLLLNAIEKAKNDNKLLALTEKEQSIYSGLPPVIKDVVTSHVFFHDESMLSLKSWRVFTRAALYGPHDDGTIKYQSENEHQTFPLVMLDS